MLIVLNAHHEGVGFTLPAIAGGTVWRLVFDTNAPNHEEQVGVGEKYVVTGRSVLLFERMLAWNGLGTPPARQPQAGRRRQPHTEIDGVPEWFLVDLIQ